MMPFIIDRKQMKADVKLLLADAQVSPRAMTALFVGFLFILNMLTYISGGEGLLPIFVSVLTALLNLVLECGLVLYCMGIRRGERMEFLTLFDGFSLAGKIIALYLVEGLFIALWAMLFVFPGIVAAYRYRFAIFNLLENPDLGVMEALEMSKRQTWGYKLQLFTLDLSYLGWELLASLPSMIQTSVISWSAAASMFPGTADSLAFSTFLPDWGWALVSNLWLVVIAPFYLPNYKCVELGYFETAKTTSGVGMRQEPTDSI